MEAVDLTLSGYGRMTISMLDGATDSALDEPDGRCHSTARPPTCCQRPGTPRRDSARSPSGHYGGTGGSREETLPGGSHVASYKDALYSDPTVADRLTGAFRVTSSESGVVVVHVQLVRGGQADSAFENRLRTALGIPPSAGQVIASPYETFPYGMSLDYERKFAD